MKIAHINLIINYNVALIKKVTQQAKVAQDENIDIDFILLQAQSTEINDNVQKITIDLPQNKFFKFLSISLGKYKFIADYVDINKYDVIILRNIIPAQASFKHLYKKFNGKIITEHHTNEYKELLCIGNIFRRFSTHFLEKVYGPRILSSIAGIIAVTDEIRKVELKKINKKIPNKTISNGIDVESIPFTQFVPFDGRQLNLIFTSSNFNSWQGLDRLLLSIQNYNGPCRINLDIVGKIINTKDTETVNRIQNNRSNVKITYYHELKSEELDKVFEKATIAISVLGLYRKGMKEACALKTREYLARGIPFIYAYDDIDLVENLPYCLKFINDDSYLDIEEIIQFAKDVSLQSNISKNMREYALKHVDWKIKLNQMVTFAQNV